MKSILKIVTVILAMANLLVVGCDKQTTPTEQPMLSSMPNAAQWQRVTQLRIVFAHQSVGGNILNGIKHLANEQNIPLTIAESRTSLSGAGIQHFHVGRNEDPNGKLADFRDALNNASATADVALLKFCFIDFTPAIDPQQLAQNYIATLDELARAHPHTIFVPMTSPLTVAQNGPRAWLKKILGEEPGGYASNARRQLFNQILRAHYPDKLLFDIAALESNRGQIGIDYRGTHVEALNPNISDDGGHLNNEGQRLLGGALIAHIATVSTP